MYSLSCKAKKRRNMSLGVSSSVLKREIEARLSARIPSALSPRPQQAPKLLATGIEAVDGMLGGGLPIGCISEFSGASGSGRTALSMATLGVATQEYACAYIDANDTLDPYSAAAAGVQLKNLLWVRFAANLDKPLIGTQQPTTKSVSLQPLAKPVPHSRSHHPRMEMKGMDQALVKMLEQKAHARMQKAQGTPGYPNQKLSLSKASDEQIAYDHFNARRADETDPLRQLDRMAAVEACKRAEPSPQLLHTTKQPERPWTKLDKVIRATDQVLQSGGFRIVVLDLATTPPEQALRIPAATWFRFRRAAQESDAILLLLTQQPCARSSAGCVLDCTAIQSPHKQQTILSGREYAVTILRQRAASNDLKKAPGRAVQWNATPQWMRAAGH